MMVSVSCAAIVILILAIVLIGTSVRAQFTF